ncbi:MAG: TIGR02206 family membrane protein [Anaerolineae bacterium]|nr:TIGR02206 family membrane protein [Anaerolineae bacterium]
MEQFFTRYYNGNPFILFGASHLVALGAIAALNIWLIKFGKHFSGEQRKVFRNTLATTLLINEGLWHLWNLTTGQWSLQTMLPLQLCSVFVFLSAIMLYTGSKTIYDFAYFLGIGGALQALLTPDAGIYGFPHFRYFQVFISHGGIVTAAIFMTAVEGFRPTWRTLMKVIIGGNLYMLLVGGINLLLDSNYLMICHKPYTPSVLDLLPAWPWYLIHIEVIGVITFILLYLPFAISDWRRLATQKPPAVA